MFLARATRLKFFGFGSNKIRLSSPQTFRSSVFRLRLPGIHDSLVGLYLVPYFRHNFSKPTYSIGNLTISGFC